jgi:hypothetical protein
VAREGDFLAGAAFVALGMGISPSSGKGCRMVRRHP